MTTYHVIATNEAAAGKLAAFLFLDNRPGNSLADTVARSARQPSFMGDYYVGFTATVENASTGLKIDVLKWITGEKP